MNGLMAIKTRQKNMTHAQVIKNAAGIYLNMFATLASNREAPVQMKDDLATVVEWMGAEDAASITDAQRAKFQRAMGAYMLEGKAPSSRLALGSASVGSLSDRSRIQPIVLYAILRENHGA